MHISANNGQSAFDLSWYLIERPEMMWYWIFAIFSLVVTRISCEDAVNLTFPDGFSIGVGSSAYQIEGAWNESGKGESIWDWKCHNKDFVSIDGTTGDVACDFYHKYEEDIARMGEIGFDHFRFSVSWTRVLPNGFSNEVNTEGLQFYKNVVATLLENGIEPMVTLYHNDLPRKLEEFGGWKNELIVGWFSDYARIVFTELGPYVKYFFTINQPQQVCLTEDREDEYYYDISKYLCGHNLLKAHATVYHMYNDEFRDAQQGQIGLVLTSYAYYAVNESDTVSPDTAYQFHMGWFAHPVFVGDYPDIVKNRVALVSEYQGFIKSRLPEFSEEWIEYINGTSDFVGLNYYTARMVEPDPDEVNGIYNTDTGLIDIQNESWDTSSTAVWLSVVPEGFGWLLRKVRDEYNNPDVIITENGYSDDGALEDYTRMKYHYDHFVAMFEAMNDGCNVKGYLAWSFLDSFEFFHGYTLHFGVFRVDFDDEDRTRTPRLSASWWQEITNTRVVQEVPTENVTAAESTSGSDCARVSWVYGIFVSVIIGIELLR